MANKPQTLSKGQEEHVIKILKKTIIKWVTGVAAVLTTVTGLSLLQIASSLHKKMEDLVAAQFEEPRIRKTVEDAAATRATNILTQQLQPEVQRVKSEMLARLVELDKLANQGKEIREKIGGMQSDIVRVEKAVATIEYYSIKGRNHFPNPYSDKITAALNEILVIAIPDPAERGQFVTQLGSPNI